MDRLLLWQGLDSWRTECASVRVEDGALSAHGTQLGVEPQPYRLDYRLRTDSDLVTEVLEVSVLQGGGLRRRLLLERAPDGTWKADDRHIAEVDGARDCDLALSPFTNYMPVARLAGQPEDHVMAWVSVPELEVSRSEQRYEPLGRDRARYVGLDHDFTAELALDSDGFVTYYPGLAQLVGGS